MSEKAKNDIESGANAPVIQTLWDKKKRSILIAAAGLALLSGAYLAYLFLYLMPNEEKAQDEIFRAEQNFRKDSISLALNGNTSTPGFLKVIRKYKGTKAANLARYYAGICYLQLGDYKNAADQLEAFDDNGALQAGAKAEGLLGDAYSELKQTDKAVAHYKKAASMFEEDQAMSSEYLFRAALLLELNGKNKEAGDFYLELKKKFPRSEKGFLAEKYLARLGIITD